MATSSPDLEVERPPVAATGVPGLDDILHGGLPRGEMHMIQGTAGTGKTTLALQFLREGVRTGEPCLYVTLSQSAPHLMRMARSHGWSMAGITIHEMTPGTVADRVASRQTVLPTVEVELEQLFHDLDTLIKKVKPLRAVIDSITIFQLVTGSSDRYHREIVTLRQLFIEQECTLMAMADHPAEDNRGSRPEVIFHPLCGCVIQLDQEPRPYGSARRSLRVVKARGLPNNGGHHDFKIHTGGMEAYPRLGAYLKPEHQEYQRVDSGIKALDELLGGGLEQGTSCLIVGPSGTGKSSLATVFARTIADHGGHAAIYLFDERPEMYLARSESIGIPLRQKVAAGCLMLQQVDPGEISPGEFAQQVRSLVEQKQTKLVCIDSVSGYFAAMGAANVLVTQLHELVTYLTRSGVLLLMCGVQEGFMSIGVQDAVDVSYLSDTIMMLGFYEAEARIHRFVAVVKKKHGEHDTSIRELSITDGGIAVGEHPLTQFRHLLVPNPQAADEQAVGDGRR